MAGWASFTDDEIKRDGYGKPSSSSKRNKNKIDDSHSEQGDYVRDKKKHKKHRSSGLNYSIMMGLQTPSDFTDCSTCDESLTGETANEEVKYLKAREDLMHTSHDYGVPSPKRMSNSAPPYTGEDYSILLSGKNTPMTYEDYHKNLKKSGLTDDLINELELDGLKALPHKEQEILEENKRKEQTVKEQLQERIRKTQSEAQSLKELQRSLAVIEEQERRATEADTLKKKIGYASYRLAQAKKRYDQVEKFLDTSWHHLQDKYHLPKARKRFDRAEQEYNQSRDELNDKKTALEKLTDELITCLQKNEDKKSEQLENIMSRLDVAGNSISESKPPVHKEAATPEEKRKTSTSRRSSKSKSRGSSRASSAKGSRRDAAEGSPKQSAQEDNN